MGREGGRALLRRVDAVRQGIEAWRSQRPKPPAMPEDLWTAAVSLACEHGVYAISQSLRIDYGALKRRVDEAGGEEDRGEDRGSEFVEVRGAQLLESRATEEDTARESVVEMTRTDGARLVVRLPAQERVDVVGLASAFWDRGR